MLVVLNCVCLNNFCSMSSSTNLIKISFSGRPTQYYARHILQEFDLIIAITGQNHSLIHYRVGPLHPALSKQQQKSNLLCAFHFWWNYNHSGTSFNYLQTYVGTRAEGCYLAEWVCELVHVWGRTRMYNFFCFSNASVCIVFLYTDFSALPFGLCEFRLLCLHYCSGPWDSLEDSACL